MASEMTKCPWQEIDEFQSALEFERFIAWIELQLAEGNAAEEPVIENYFAESSFRERWFRHVKSGCVWRLVYPDFPFTGLFEYIEREA